MDAEKKVKKGTAEKRSVRKATKTNLKPTKQVDLKAAAEGSDLIEPEVAETPTTPRKKGNRRGSGLSSSKAAPDKLAAAFPVTEYRATVSTGESAAMALAEPTAEQIQLRAYFISERRKSSGLPGDETADWVQAREELRNEPHAG